MKNNIYVSEKLQSILGCALRIIEEPEYENLIGMVLILKGI